MLFKSAALAICALTGSQAAFAETLFPPIPEQYVSNPSPALASYEAKMMPEWTAAMYANTAFRCYIRSMRWDRVITMSVSKDDLMSIGSSGLSDADQSQATVLSEYIANIVPQEVYTNSGVCAALNNGTDPEMQMLDAAVIKANED